MKLTTLLRRFPDRCGWGIVIIWIIGLVVVIPSWMLVANLPYVAEHSNPESEYHIPHPPPPPMGTGDHIMTALREQQIAAAKANPHYDLHDYFRDVFAAKKQESILYANQIRFTNDFSYITRLQDQAGLLGSGRSSSLTQDQINAIRRPFEKDFVHWTLKNFHTITTEAGMYMPGDGEDWHDDVTIIGWELGWRYLAFCLLAALLYLFRWGRDARQEDAEKLAHGKLDIPFWAAVLFWPAFFWKYPFDRLRELRITITEQQHRNDILEPITDRDRSRYRTIARNREAYKAWRQEIRERAQPRWGFALATCACLFLLMAPAQRAEAADRSPPRFTRSVSVSAVTRARGDPVAYRSHQLMVAEPTWPPPPEEDASPPPRRQWAALAARLNDGWRRSIDHIPLPYPG